MIYTKPEMVLEAELAAIEADIEPALLCALVDVSSDWHPEKAEFENAAGGIPNFELRGVDPDEWNFQNYRWGLAQLLGRDARGAGFQGDMLKLLEPESNLTWAAAVLKQFISYGGTVERALMLWRGSAAGNFPLLVIDRRGFYREFLAQAGRPAKLESRKAKVAPIS